MKVGELLKDEALRFLNVGGNLIVTVKFSKAMEMRFTVDEDGVSDVAKEASYFGQPITDCRVLSWSSDGPFVSIMACVENPRFSKSSRALMETAMCIMETYDDLCAEGGIDPTAGEGIDSMERLAEFSGWAEEFEEKYHKDERYSDDFLNLVREYAEDKIKHWI